MFPNKVRLLVAGQERFVSVAALAAGEVFVVKAGERIAADGHVVTGNSHTDEALLTGESAPAAKRPGDQVAAGSVNLEGVLHVQALRTAGDSTLARIIALVNQALTSRSPLERAADRVARVFVPCVMVLSSLTFALYYFAGRGGAVHVVDARHYGAHHCLPLCAGIGNATGHHRSHGFGRARGDIGQRQPRAGNSGQGRHYYSR